MPPVVIDYKIGPLPISSATKVRPLEENYAIREIPYPGRFLLVHLMISLLPSQTARGFQMADFKAMGDFVQTTFSELGELTMDLFGARADGHANDTLTGGGSAPVSFDGSWRRMWMPM